MASDKYPTIEYVRQCLRYEDGRLYWIERPKGHFPDERSWSSFNGRFCGLEAGRIGLYGSRGHRSPRCLITVNRIQIYRSVVVWAIHRERWPENEIDHENCDSLDDRIENLREGTRSQNAANTRMKSTNTSGAKGVSWSKAAGKWRARITVNRQEIQLGCFDSIEEAKAAYDKASQEYFGDFSRSK